MGASGLSLGSCVLTCLVQVWSVVEEAWESHSAGEYGVSLAFTYKVRLAVDGMYLTVLAFVLLHARHWLAAFILGAWRLLTVGNSSR